MDVLVTANTSTVTIIGNDMGVGTLIIIMMYIYKERKNIYKMNKKAQVKSMDDNCGEWVECMGVASGCGEQEVGVASGSGWNLWVWLLGVVLRRYIDFLILLIPTPLVSVLFCSSIPTFLFIL